MRAPGVSASSSSSRERFVADNRGLTAEAGLTGGDALATGVAAGERAGTETAIGGCTGVCARIVPGVGAGDRTGVAAGRTFAGGPRGPGVIAGVMVGEVAAGVERVLAGVESFLSSASSSL